MTMIDQADMSRAEALQTEVASVIEAQRPQSFGGLLQLFPGLPPDAALQALHQLRAQGAHRAGSNDLIISAATPVARLEDPIDGLLLRPHPLDYEWRFDNSTRRVLSDELSRLVGPTGHVIALGCPTVAYELLRSHPRLKVTLIDANPGLPLLSDSSRYRQLSTNLLEETLDEIEIADAVVADPPFYPRYVDAFLSGASRVARPGSFVLMALPAGRTRPSAEADVVNALATAHSLSLELHETRFSGVRYLRPRFERLVHEAQGLLGVPDDWRVGDLYVFTRLAGEPASWRPTATCIDVGWVEVVIGGSRIRVQLDQSDEGHDTALSLFGEVVAGDVLDTVSSRDPRRTLANVWTDGNVVWHTNQPALLLVILQSLATGKDPSEAALLYCDNEGLVRDPHEIKSAVRDLVERVSLLS
jgi:hypothetical protein